jgi:hypothetical protein
MGTNSLTLWTTVEASFEVPTRGSWIIPAPSEAEFRFRIKDPIQLRTPEGRILNTHIDAVEFANGTRMVIGLPRELTKQDVPIGTEIWLVRQQAL